MKSRQLFLVLYRLFLCAVLFPLVGAASLYAQDVTAQDPNISAITEVDTNRPGGGIHVDPNGLVLRVSSELTLQQRLVAGTAARNRLPADVFAYSPMRCISLNRLEKNIAEADGKITEEMMFLAGLQQITYVFYFSDSKDIVIAGPAEGWIPGNDRTMVGIRTLQPVLELRHLVTALRAYVPGGNGGKIVGCSIDPTLEGNMRMLRFVQQFNSTPGGTNQEFIRGIRESIGNQTVRVDGVPATTHAAQMMVAADYRMKRMALGADPAPVRGFQSFINNTEPNLPNTAFRWYFVPDYDSVLVTEDRTGMQLVGKGVKLVGENELLDAQGNAVAVPGGLDRGSAAFTRSFTQNYPQIARQTLVFAQLKNWIDMLICAAHIQREDFYGKSDWSMAFFGSEEKYKLETYTTPKEVEPVVEARLFGRGQRQQLIAPVGGGIVIEAERALDAEHAKLDKNGKIAAWQKQMALDLPEGVWWWDVR